MNRKRRGRLREAITHLNRTVAIVEEVRDDEQDAVEQTPENLQTSERFSAMEEALDALDDALSCLNDAEESIERACEG